MYLGFLDFRFLGGTMVIFFVLLIFNIGLSLIPASLARDKGYSFFGFFLLGFFVSFLLALIIVACLSPKNQFVYGQSTHVHVHQGSQSVNQQPIDMQQTPRANNHRQGNGRLLSLRCAAGELLGQTIKIPLAGLTVGRSPEFSTLLLKNNNVSRKHFTLNYVASMTALTIVDYSSTGTYLDNQKLNRGVPYQAREGQRIQFVSNSQVFEITY